MRDAFLLILVVKGDYLELLLLSCRQSIYSPPTLLINRTKHKTAPESVQVMCKIPRRPVVSEIIKPAYLTPATMLWSKSHRPNVRVEHYL